VAGTEAGTWRTAKKGGGLAAPEHASDINNMFGQPMISICI